jgi:hypothetical protein
MLVDAASWRAGTRKLRLSEAAANPNGYGFVEPAIPELSIAVVEEA